MTEDEIKDYWLDPKSKQAKDWLECIFELRWVKEESYYLKLILAALESARWQDAEATAKQRLKTLAKYKQKAESDVEGFKMSKG